MRFALTDIILAPIIWVILGTVVSLVWLWGLFVKLGEFWVGLGDYFWPQYNYYPQEACPKLEVFRADIKKAQDELRKQNQYIMEQYYTVLKEKIQGSIDLDELQKYADKLDKVAARTSRHFPLEWYQELVDLYYNKLEELESIHVLDAQLRKKEYVNSGKT